VEQHIFRGENNVTEMVLAEHYYNCQQEKSKVKTKVINLFENFE
jgi:hypothetical protein